MNAKRNVFFKCPAKALFLRKIGTSGNWIIKLTLLALFWALNFACCSKIKFPTRLERDTGRIFGRQPYIFKIKSHLKPKMRKIFDFEEL